MNRFLAAISLCALVGACSTAQLAATGTRAALSPEAEARIVELCRVAQPLLPLAGSWPAASEIALFVASYCNQMLAGVVPITTDVNTPTWLETNVAALLRLLRR